MAWGLTNERVSEIANGDEAVPTEIVALAREVARSRIRVLDPDRYAAIVLSEALR